MLVVKPPTLRILFWLRLCGGLGLATAVGTAYGGDGCGAWRMADVDPAGGKYMTVVQLRACDLTGGVSAFVQFQNSGLERLKLRYRIYTDEKNTKEGDLLLEPAQIQRGPTCQQCSSRKGGIQRWELVSIEPLPAGEETSGNPIAKPPAVTPVVPASPPPPVQAAPSIAPVSVSPPPAPAPQPVAAAAKTASPPEGLVTEDGTVIPWDQLPPEFRPKK